MLIRMLKELNENYISMKKNIETVNKKQLKMKNAICEMKNTLKGINERVDRAKE